MLTQNARTLDATDARLLDLIQQEVPLVERPYQQIAERLGLGEEDVLARLRALKSGPRPVVRQISAIFDSASLGYQSTLVAAKVDEARIGDAAAVINRHPGVSHNYRRTNAYNLWYTLAVPPDSRLGLQGTVDVLHRQSGAAVMRLMPTLRLFKIGVRLKISGEEGGAASQTARPGFTDEHRRQGSSFSLTEADKPLIRVLQQDLPIEPRPFDDWAVQAGVSVDALLEAAKAYESRRWMRRFSAVLRHREVGFTANAMGVWKVPQGREEEFGKKAATFDAVSHCYLRPTYPDWAYNLFTMIHGPTEDACRAVLRAISEATGVTEYDALYSTHEYKKIRVKYFTGDIEAWESANAAEC